MGKNNKEPIETVRIKGSERINTLHDVIDFIESTEGRNSNRTDAIYWLLKKFRDDKIK